jgi:hypothetical protein
MVPATSVYRVSPRSMAAMAASLTLRGVSKSGSPTDREMMSRPCAFSARALPVMAMVCDGEMRLRRSAMRFMTVPGVPARPPGRAGALFLPKAEGRVHHRRV